jgi:glycosyltransferase involved in cell wall biosynthesis
LLNWQDIENPEAGGAEIHLHEIFGRLAERGHEVRAIVSGWAGAPRSALIDNIAFLRVGGRYSYAYRAPRAAQRLLGTWEADVIVEDINKVPLFAPYWTRRPVVPLVPHLFGTTVFCETNFAMGSMVWASERAIPKVYRNCSFQAISISTATDLNERGVPVEQVSVIHPGIDHEYYCPDKETQRATVPTILYVGRLKRYKGIDVLIKALAKLRDREVDAQLVISGRGNDRSRLERLTKSLGLQDRVDFVGYIGEAEKLHRLRSAWVLAYPSPKEGWGITIVEASACGTPVIASDSPGLRESVRTGESGLLVPHGMVDLWVQAFEKVFSDPGLRGRLGMGGRVHATQFSWERAANETEKHLKWAVRDTFDH